MGYYIEVPDRVNKAAQIKRLYNGEIVFYSEALKVIESGSHDVVVVVHNPTFEAAGFCYSRAEFKRFVDIGDSRPRDYVLLPPGVGAKLSGYTKEKSQ